MHLANNALEKGFPKLVRRMDAAAIDALKAAFNDLRLSKGEVLCSYGQPADTLYLIVEGRLSVSLAVGESKLLLDELTPGQWVCDVSVIEPGPASVTVQAATDCILLSLSHQQLENLSLERPGVAAELLRALSNGLVKRVRASISATIEYDDSDRLVLTHPAEEQRRRLLRTLARLFSFGGGERWN